MASGGIDPGGLDRSTRLLIGRCRKHGDVIGAFVSRRPRRQEGAEGFLKVQYTAIAKIAVFLTAFIVLSYVMRPSLGPGEEGAVEGVRRLGNATLGVISGLCFVVGALCSAAAGYISM